MRKIEPEMKIPRTAAIKKHREKLLEKMDKDPTFSIVARKVYLLIFFIHIHTYIHVNIWPKKKICVALYLVGDLFL